MRKSVWPDYHSPSLARRIASWLRLGFCSLPVFLLSSTVLAAPVELSSELPSASPERVVQAVRGVLTRFVGNRSAEFDFRLVPSDAGTDYFEVEAGNGRVTVLGTSGVALCHGAYTYLRDFAHCQFTLGGKHVSLPDVLPDCPRRRVQTPFRWRMQDNICVFGYTTPFFKWPEWERYLDWMALHGMNMQYAPVGSEAIWARVWRKIGLTDQELREFFTGPAFFPWHRMGNINHHDGPPPDSFFPQTIELQKKILKRMRELGIEPIAPAFSGFVPAALRRARPEAKIIPLAPWAGFSGPCRTFLLDPLDPLFVEIGRMFIREWKREFGPAHFYQADTFNELQVPVPKDRAGRYSRLGQYSWAVYSAIKAGDPHGIWVMMGWLFRNQPDFWDPASVKAFLAPIPDDEMIILDLNCEQAPQWKRLDAFFGKQWMFSLIPNWGGRTQLGGPLPFYASAVPTISSEDRAGNLVGFAISPEGTENNEVVHELLTEAAWRDQPIRLNSWLRKYCLARYGAAPESVLRAWELLTKTVYSRPVTKINLLQRVPRYADNAPEIEADFRKAVELFLSAADQEVLRTNQLYCNDAIELATQLLAFETDRMLYETGHRLRSGEVASSDSLVTRAFTLMGQIDTLLNSHSLFRLERWVQLARRWGQTPAERDYYEQDAKRIVTVWGGPYLTEYAARLWSGLVGDYYLRRWSQWYQAQRSGRDFDLAAWQERWITTPSTFPRAVYDDPLGVARRLVRRWSGRRGTL